MFFIFSLIGPFAEQLVQSRLIVLKSLSAFLIKALASPNHTSAYSADNPSEILLPTWYLASAFTSREAYKAFDKLLQPFLQSAWPSSSSRYWQPEIEPEKSDEDFAQSFDFAAAALGDQWTLQELSEVVNQSDTFTDEDILHSTDATFVAVHPILHPNDAKREWLMFFFS
jgi:hypothetical protein